MKLNVLVSFTESSDFVTLAPRGRKVHLTLYLPTSCAQEQGEKKHSNLLRDTEEPRESQSEEQSAILNNWAILLPTASRKKTKTSKIPHVKQAL